MRQVGRGWTAVCADGEEYRGATVYEAIRDAVGHERGEALTLHAQGHGALSQWVSEQAERIEREARGEG